MINLAQITVITVVQEEGGRVRIVASDGGRIHVSIAERLTQDQALDLMDQLADGGLGAADIEQSGRLMVRTPGWAQR